jgi:hypothetical protein
MSNSLIGLIKRAGATEIHYKIPMIKIDRIIKDKYFSKDEVEKMLNTLLRISNRTHITSSTKVNAIRMSVQYNIKKLCLRVRKCPLK